MTYDLDFCITNPDQWPDDLTKFLRGMASSEARSVRLTVPNFGLKTHIQNLLNYTGFGHVFVTVPYLRSAT